MNSKRQTLTAFFIPYFIFAVVWFSLIMTHEKGELHLLLNSYHRPFWDYFFKYFTYLGGEIPLIIVVLLLFYRFNTAFYLLATIVFNSILTNSLKVLFGVPRPVLFFQQNFPDVVLPLVDGVEMFKRNGFPSGHTSAVFATMLCIALIIRNKYASFICLLIAVLGGYSRVYLSQHFAQDVMLGSIIGIASALLLYPLYQKWQQQPWMNGSILNRRQPNRL